MRNLIYIVIGIAFFNACQKSTPNRKSDTCAISGRYFNKTVLDDCPDSIPGFGPYYALELTFYDNDSVAIDNGVEKLKRPFSNTDENCQFKITDASQFGDMYFRIERDTMLQLFDSAWTKLGSASLFEKVHSENRSNWNFDNFYNECFITGSYKQTKPESKPNPIYFLPNGQVTGIKPYLSYELCYAGDCMEETGTPAHLIDFTNDKGTSELFAIKVHADKSVIQFYRIGAPKPGIKGQRTIDELAFEIQAEQISE